GSGTLARTLSALPRTLFASSCFRGRTSFIFASTSGRSAAIFAFAASIASADSPARAATASFEAASATAFAPTAAISQAWPPGLVVASRRVEGASLRLEDRRHGAAGCRHEALQIGDRLRDGGQILPCLPRRLLALRPAG